MIEDMERLYEKYGFYDEDFDWKKLKFRLSLLEEEYIETMGAFDSENPEELVDGLIDLCVVAIGTLNLAGVDTQKAWDEVMRANLSKERGTKPSREKSGGFDLVKPKGWKGPDHSSNHGLLEQVFNERG